MSSLVFTCSRCGEYHDALAQQAGCDAPDPYVWIDEGQRLSRCVLGSDDCIIDNSQFYVRGCIFVPIVGRSDPFAWGVWVSLTQGNYNHVLELWDVEGKEAEQPIASRIMNGLEVELYPSTFNLKARLQRLPVGQRPAIRIEDEQHPLAIEQREGISEARLIEITEWLLHLPGKTGIRDYPKLKLMPARGVPDISS